MTDQTLKMEELFEEWRKLILESSDHFVSDGFICYVKWVKANTKVLFILKETNNYSGDDIAQLIKKAVGNPRGKLLWKRPTFHNVGRWAAGLANVSNNMFCYNKAQEIRREALLSCAFINIKKTSGGRVATKAVEEHAEKYSSFLRRQIDIINPDIIVFGGTYKIMKNHVIPELKKVSFRVYKYKNTIYINANHPACTKRRKLLYEQVVDNYKCYLNKS